MSDMKHRPTVGTDPEFFLKNDTRFKSAIPYIDGSKHEPEQLECGGTVQRDNVAVEFATAVAADGPDLVEKVRDCLRDIQPMIPEGHEMVVVPSAVFDEDQLDNPEALEFGCEPDYDAWKLEENEKPWPGDAGLRSCGAHLHVGCLDEDGKPMPELEFLLDFDGRISAVRAMDLFNGIVSVVLDNSAESIKRRELYGKAGCHRPTDYGVEYRVLSNYWMKSPELVMLMDSLAMDAMKVIIDGKLDVIIETIGAEEVQRIINEGDASVAEKIIEQYLIPNMSEQSKEFLAMCQGKEYGPLSKEWGV